MIRGHWLQIFRATVFDEIPGEQMAMSEPKIEPKAVAEYLYYEEEEEDGVSS